MPARLKVFRATLGFYEAVVAAPSQAAALRAWEVRENLFQHGMATVTDDSAAVEPALAQPGVVLRRSVGGSGPFTADPDLPTASTPKPKPGGKRDKAASAAPRPEPDRTALDAAERALSDAEAEHARALKAIAAERDALEMRESGLRRAQDLERRTLERAVELARKAYAKASG